jgi:hypothetical protein
MKGILLAAACVLMTSAAKAQYSSYGSGGYGSNFSSHGVGSYTKRRCSTCCLIRTVAMSIASATLLPLIGAHAETLTLCGQKIDYQPAASDAASIKGSELIGVWVGEVMAVDAKYNSQYRRCDAFAVERITPDGKVMTIHVTGDSAITQNGNKWGIKPTANPWAGELMGNNTLRFEGNGGTTVYEFELSHSNRMEGRFTHTTGDGRVFLKRQ